MNHVHHAHKLTRGAKENDSHPIEYVPLISALWVAHTRHNILVYYDATITRTQTREEATMSFVVGGGWGGGARTREHQNAPALVCSRTLNSFSRAARASACPAADSRANKPTIRDADATIVRWLMLFSLSTLSSVKVHGKYSK